MYLSRSIWFSSLWVLLLYLVSTSSAFAQGTSLHGRVTDETGAVIPGASVTVTNAAGRGLSTKSGSDGSYSFRALPTGTYQVEAAFPGMAMKQPVSFNATSQAATLNLVLSVGVGCPAGNRPSQRLLRCLGRLRKPGSDKFHGSASFNIGSDTLNSRNPYAEVKAPFLLREYGTSLVGPLGHRASLSRETTSCKM
jgi:Carboxypeptidase regulatory-like domain